MPMGPHDDLLVYVTIGQGGILKKSETLFFIFLPNTWLLFLKNAYRGTRGGARGVFCENAKRSI